MTEQLALVVIGATTDVPRCRMCARSARWLEAKRQHAMYCAGTSCNNRERICQACSSPFVMNVDGAGTKYCSTECKAAGYHPTARTTPVCCSWCGGPSGTAGMGRRYENRVWPYICAECVAPIKHVAGRLKAHHVPHERARQLLDDPGCEICGVDLLARVRDATGKVGALLVVDHDHDCCPVSAHSCGACVRGLLCRACNTAAGQLRDDPANVRALAAYLDDWLSRRPVTPILAADPVTGSACAMHLREKAS